MAALEDEAIASSMYASSSSRRLISATMSSTESLMVIPPMESKKHRSLVAGSMMTGVPTDSDLTTALQ